MARLISTIWLFFMVVGGYAQDRYLVYFTDKENNRYTLENPGEFLSQRALDRRLDDNIGYDLLDLPVSENYLNELHSAGYDILSVSKWLNAVLTEFTAADSANVADLSFVASVEKVADGRRSGMTGGRKWKESESSRLNPQGAAAYEWHGFNRFHENGKFGEGVRIAIMDASFQGVDELAEFRHLFEEDRIIMTENLVTGSNDVFTGSDDHGTRVLSVLAAERDGFFRGIVPKSEYLLFQTEEVETEFRIEEFNWTVAAEKADSAGVDVINTSLGYSYGFTDPSMNYTYDNMDGKSAMISRAAGKAVATGIIVVASAGNEGLRAWRHITAPADVDGVLAVGALAADSSLLGFSSRGPSADGRIKPDVVSQGQAVPVINGIGDLRFSSGTSFAAPIIAGYAALLSIEYPELSSYEINNLIRNSGHLSSVPDNDMGYGIPFSRTVLSIAPEAYATDIVIYPVPATTRLYWQSELPVRDVTIFDVQGKTVLKSSGIEGSIDISNLRPGIYLGQFNTGSSVRQLRILKK